MPDSAVAKLIADGADLQLQFAPAPDARTYINHQFSRYPFHICRAQYLDAEPPGMATVYLQSSAGGIFADDSLSTCMHVLPGAKAHVTTQASTVVHRMDRGNACQTVDIRVEGDGFLEYIPDPMIQAAGMRFSPHCATSYILRTWKEISCALTATYFPEKLLQEIVRG